MRGPLRLCGKAALNGIYATEIVVEKLWKACLLWKWRSSSVSDLELRRISSMPTGFVFDHGVAACFEDPIVWMIGNFICLHRKEVVCRELAMLSSGMARRTCIKVGNQSKEINLEQDAIRRG